MRGERAGSRGDLNEEKMKKMNENDKKMIWEEEREKIKLIRFFFIFVPSLGLHLHLSLSFLSIFRFSVYFCSSSSSFSFLFHYLLFLFLPSTFASLFNLNIDPFSQISCIRFTFWFDFFLLLQINNLHRSK